MEKLDRFLKRNNVSEPRQVKTKVKGHENDDNGIPVTDGVAIAQ